MQQIEFQNVCYCDAGKTILKDITLSVSPGDYISVVGPSGSGKSTLLKLFCHLISPSEGTILFHGKDMMRCDPMELRKKIGYCFQTPVLFGETVEDNLSFPYSVRGQKFDRERAAEMLERFGLEANIISHKAGTLSGGEKQRVGLVRSLLFQPEVLLLDEATSALDAENKQTVEETIRLMNEGGITVIWVTHDLAQSRKNARNLLTIENGQIASLEVLS